MAKERGVINVDAMLRSITSVQFQELLVYDTSQVSEEDRMDRRFAVLAAVIAGSLRATAVNGDPFTPDSFLRQLDSIKYGVQEQQQPQPRQTAEQIERAINLWCDTSNKIGRKTKGVRRG